MPEIAESELSASRPISVASVAHAFAVARAVHFLRRHLVGRTIKNATAIDDANVFGKVGTTGADVSAALTGKKV
jgi:hypothetical protein